MAKAGDKSNTRWLAVAETLPQSIDPVRVRWWLDRVTAEKSVTSVERLIAKHLEQARRYQGWLTNLPTMMAIANPDQCREEWQAWAHHHEEEARYWQRFSGRHDFPRQRIHQLRILAVWWNTIRGSLEPAQVWPFYAAAHEYVFGKPAPKGDIRAFPKLVQEFRETVVAEFERNPVRLISPFGTELR